MTTPDFEKIAGDLHNEVHEAAALVDAHTRVEIGWAPEDAIPILSEKLREMYELGKQGVSVPDVSMQQLIDVGLNAFGLQLFVESIADKKDSATFNPITFRFRGIRITMQPDGEIDTRHH